MLPQFDYARPDTLQDACRLLAANPDAARPLAGGTDLIFDMRLGKKSPALVVDLKCVPGLDEISFDADGAMRLGALVRTRDIEQSDRIRQEFSALTDAIDVLASVQIRNRARLGGNLCHASPSADTPPALIALGATVDIAGPDGTRSLPLEAFFTGPGKTVLTAGEVLAAVTVPPVPAGGGSAYIRNTVRKAMDLAIIGVGAMLVLDRDGRCAKAGIGLGAVAPKPLRAHDAEAFLTGKQLDDATIAEAAKLARSIATPISDVRSQADYRADMVEVYTRRTLALALSRAAA